MDRTDALVYTGGSFAIAGGLLAILTPWIVLALVACAAGLASTLVVFYLM